MSIHNRIQHARQEYERVRDDYELGYATRDDVARARRELGELRWERDNLHPPVEIMRPVERQAVLA